MKLRRLFGCAALVVLTLQAGTAQVPAGAPSGSTGQCNDSTYAHAPSKRGACKGHQGVKVWFATAPTKTSPAAATADDISSGLSTDPDRNVSAIELGTAAPTPQAKAPTTASTRTAPGGGRGLVWLNTSTTIYHCSDT